MAETYNFQLPTIEPPDLIKDLPAWVVWQSEPNEDPSKKPLKVPYYVNGSKRRGTMGSEQDRKHLVTFDKAREYAAKHNYSGVGFCLMPEFGIVAGDFDNCVAHSGELDQGVHPDVLALTAGTYAEYSPSNCGVRAFWRSESQGNGKDAHGEPFGFEVFSTKGFVTFTGCMLHQTELLAAENHVAQITPEVVGLIKHRLIDRPAVTIDQDDPASVLEAYTPAQNVDTSEAAALLQALDPSMSYDNWIAVGMALHHEFDGNGAGLTLWDTWSANSKDKYTDGLCQVKWESFKTNTNRANITLATLRHLVKQSQAQQVAAKAVAITEEGTDPLAPIQAAEFASRTIDTEYLIKDFLPKGELSVVYGQPGSGKTFAVLDMCMAVANDTPWRGKEESRVTQSSILYVACEGGSGFRKRLRAYEQHFNRDLAQAPFYVIDASPNMMDIATVNRVLEHATDIDNLGVIVVDTLARALHGGDENSSQDLGTLINHCTHLYRETGASVLLVHHSGKAKAAAMRGHSSLQGAAYCVIEVKEEPTYRTLKVEKLKDGEANAVYPFQLFPVTVGQNDLQEDIVSCVVQYLDAAPKPVELSRSAAQVLHTLREVLENGEPLTIAHVVNETLDSKDRDLVSAGKSPLSPDARRQNKKRLRQGVHELAQSMPSSICVADDDETIQILNEDSFLL